MYTIKEGPFWQLQEAKAMFSAVVRSASQEPQIITIHGKESAVILSIEDYKKLSSPKDSLVSFMQQSPLASVKLELPERQSEKMRKTGL
ncbi:MAG: type II toxin-antitoxin system Phd/YefM family antitoxin [Treponema sp.]|nr:type II toxin-antitoxin system Phd/YefM family antitoxin [Treponema sp.]